MLIASVTCRLGLRTLSGDLDSVAARVTRERPGINVRVQPRSADEQLWRMFSCEFKYRDGPVRGGTVAFPDDFVITASRILMIGRRNRDKKGIEHFTVASANRADFAHVQVINDRKGNVKSVELRSNDASATIDVSFVSSRTGGFTGLLQWLDPSSVALLDETAARRHREEKRLAAERSAEAELRANEDRLKTAKSRFDHVPLTPAVRSPINLTAGSIFDHRKTFHYRVAASTAQCIDAFVTAFEAGGGLLLRAKWDLQRSSDGAVAVYEGRKGVSAVGAILSQSAASEQEGAVGSEIRFEIAGREDDRTYCTMWLAEHASRLGFVNDGRFFRPYMRTVEAELAKLDPSVQVIKV